MFGLLKLANSSNSFNDKQVTLKRIKSIPEKDLLDRERILHTLFNQSQVNPFGK